MSRAEQAVVTDLDEATGKDVLEKATNELLGGDGATPGLVSGGVFERESDLAIIELAEAVVADGDAKDVRGEIFEGMFTRADGFGMDDPVFAPDAGWYLSKEFGLLEGITELGAEDA